MAPKDKAEELINKYWKSCYDKHDIAKLHKEDAKKCALIAVDEMIPIVESYEDALSASQKSDELLFWKEVKQEIEKL